MAVKERDVAIAVLELSDVEERLEHATRVGESNSSSDVMQRVFEDLNRLHAELQTTIDQLQARIAGRGVAVSEAAEYLRVSPPTVRTWLARGVLERVNGRKPLRITQDSLRRTQKLLEELRRRGQDRDWLQALIDYLHDSEARARPSIQQGLEELRRGETEPA